MYSQTLPHLLGSVKTPASSLGRQRQMFRRDGEALLGRCRSQLEVIEIVVIA